APINAPGMSGWSFALVPGSTAADARFTVGSGTSSSGSVFSFGSPGQMERALGTSPARPSTSPFGQCLAIATPNVITRISIFYTGEQWRYGGSATVNRLRFSYSIGASNIADGEFVNVDSLSFTSPIVSGTAGSVDGNFAANRMLIESTLDGLS